MTDRAKLKARLTIVSLVVVFLGPILVAFWLNVGGSRPGAFATTNEGELLTPAVFLAGDALEAAAGRDLGRRLRGAWTLIVAADDCAASCRDALVSTRQARLGTGRDAKRVDRLLVLRRGARALDAETLSEHPDLGLAFAPSRWHEALPGRQRGTAIYLVDPQGYVVLRYRPTARAKSLVKDLERLLKISKIG